MTGMTFERGNTTFTLSVEGTSWLYSTPNPNYAKERTFEESFMIDQYKLMGMEVPDEPETLTTRFAGATVFNALTPYEGRLLLGYCSHYAEHGSTHADELAAAIVEAVKRRDWDAVKALQDELYTLVNALTNVKDTAVLIIENAPEVGVAE